MSVNILPTEILQKIFENLNAGILANCRAACRRWRDIIDNSPNFWMELCEERFGEVSADERRKADLSWYEFYKSLLLWAKISSAEAKIHSTKIKTCNFEIFPNGIIACPQVSDKITWYAKKDTIVYYDLTTLKERNRLHLDLDIDYYRETNQMIVIIDRDRLLHVIPKANHKQFVVGNLQQPYDVKYREFVVFESEIYFKDPQDNLIVAQLGVVDNEITVQTVNLGSLDRQLCAATRVNDDQINFLVTRGIISLKDGEFEELCSINNYMEENINVKLEANGFKWSQSEVFYDLDNYDFPFPGIPKNITSYKSPVICGYGNIVLIGTTRGVIHVFRTVECRSRRKTWCCEFFENNKEYKAKLVKSVDLKKSLKEGCNTVYSKKGLPSGNIEQLEIVETINGHKIVVLYGDTICIVDLLHQPKRGKKRTATKKPKSNGKKSKKQ